MRLLFTFLHVLIFSFFFITKLESGNVAENKFYIPKYAKISGFIYERTDSSYYSEKLQVSKKRLVYIEQKYKDHIIKSSLKYKIPKELVIAIIYIENGKHVDPKAVGSSGELGLMQIQPSTAGIKNKELLFDPAINIDIGSKILATIMYESIDNDSIVRFDKVAIRYNAGYWAYNKCRNFSNLDIVLSNIKPITRKYVLQLVGKNGILETLSKNNTKQTI